MKDGYVHGYHSRESARLRDQAWSVVDLLHSDTTYPAGSTVLEVGCGTGAQTLTLARNSPDARITSFDRSTTSLEEAQARTQAAGLRNVEFRQADIFDLTFGQNSFDHVFVCFVLEHLSRPIDADFSAPPLTTRVPCLGPMSRADNVAERRTANRRQQHAKRIRIYNERRSGRSSDSRSSSDGRIAQRWHCCCP